MQLNTCSIVVQEPCVVLLYQHYVYTPYATPIEAGIICQPLDYTRVLKSTLAYLSRFRFNTVVYLFLFILLRLTEYETESETIQCIVTCCGFQQSAH